jgi:hypothetical protein
MIGAKGISLTSFSLDWHSGPTAQLELFAPKSQGTRSNYQLKYTSPFRTTIRPPVDELLLGANELDPIIEELNKLATTLYTKVRQPSNRISRTSTGIESRDDPMVTVGNMLLDLLLPRNIDVELRSGPLFIEIGVDEQLLEYPWELMHDGEDFLCLKHFIGRFVNSATQPKIPLVNRPGWRIPPTTKLSMLVVSVPNPQPRSDGQSFDRLDEAEKETEAILRTLQNIEGLEVNFIGNNHATWDNVYNALRQGTFHIVHFNGHATYDDKDPFGSGLVLYNRNMTAGQVFKFFCRKPPVLCFMNGCETGRMKAPQAGSSMGWKTHYNTFGLARAFLETGSYLIGSRWKLGDEAAAAFAEKFYSSLVKGGDSLGYAITEARKTCQRASTKDQFSWASYIFYGDPRLCFIKNNSTEIKNA